MNYFDTFLSQKSRVTVMHKALVKTLNPFYSEKK